MICSDILRVKGENESYDIGVTDCLSNFELFITDLYNY